MGGRGNVVSAPVFFGLSGTGKAAVEIEFAGGHVVFQTTHPAFQTPQALAQPGQGDGARSCGGVAVRPGIGSRSDGQGSRRRHRAASRMPAVVRPR